MGQFIGGIRNGEMRGGGKVNAGCAWNHCSDPPSAVYVSSMGSVFALLWIMVIKAWKGEL